jgi:hypothetical protein
MLTASDGTGLTLTALDARAVIEEPLAFTELRLVFDNPEARTLEGTFRIALPPGAAISRFAMRTSDQWQEGEVVERKAARSAYEDFLHRKQDPALLEQAAGNEFSARVFPIPAHARKEILVSYSQPLTNAQPYVVPLQGLPSIESVRVDVARDGAPLGHLERTGYLPDRDFELDPAQLRATGGLQSGDLAVLRLHPFEAAGLESAADPLSGGVFLVDTSASRALGYAAEISLVEALVRGVATSTSSDASVAVVAFDQTADVLFRGKAAEFGEREVGALKARGPLGASDLGGALARAGDVARELGSSRIVLISDGVATAFETSVDRLAAGVAALRDDGVTRLDAVRVGGIHDDALLRRLVTAGLAHDGVVLDGADDPSELVRRINLGTRSGITVDIEGARFAYPRRIDGAQPGDEVLVYVELEGAEPPRVRLGGAPVEVEPLTPGEGPLLARAVAQARIAEKLEAPRTADTAAALEKDVVALSTRYRVLSPFTSMLVLESDADYDRFRIDRRALGDILAVQDGRLTVNRRTGVPVQPAKPRRASQAPVTAPQTGRFGVTAPPGRTDLDVEDTPRQNPTTPSFDQAPAPTVEAPYESRATGPWGTEDTSGAGGLGLSGIGAGGGGLGHGAGSTTGGDFGSGQGRLGGAHATRAPRLIQGPVTVNGMLPVEVIQRIVRQNFGRFRLCYEGGLEANATLAGRVTVRFLIDRAGSVANAVDAGSDLPDATVVGCVVRAMKSLSFPEPGGGMVQVVYPLQFAPDGATGEHGMAASAPPLEKPVAGDPYTGRFQIVMSALARGDTTAALAEATRWHDEMPGDVLSVVALGEAFEAGEGRAAAGRVYGSIIDLFPARADLRRFAGARLERLSDPKALELAADSYEKAKEQRPDHPSSHRLLAFARLRQGHFEAAFDAARAGAARSFRTDRFPGVDRILKEDLGLIAAAWARAAPSKRAEILAALHDAGGTPEDAPSLRFVLSWETDANDVDFHIFDDHGGHAFYGRRQLASGGELYADVTTGYGPECFTIRGGRAARAAKYTLQANYYARGPMGYGMGKLEVIDHDGKGGLSFEERPYVVMKDRAFVDLGTVGL